MQHAAKEDFFADWAEDNGGCGEGEVEHPEAHLGGVDNGAVVVGDGDEPIVGPVLVEEDSAEEVEGGRCGSCEDGGGEGERVGGFGEADLLSTVWTQEQPGQDRHDAETKWEQPSEV